MKIFLSHVNTHQRTYNTEKALNNQVNKMTHPVGADQPLPSHMLLVQWALIQASLSVVVNR